MTKAKNLAVAARFFVFAEELFVLVDVDGNFFELARLENLFRAFVSACRVRHLAWTKWLEVQGARGQLLELLVPFSDLLFSRKIR